MGGGRPGVGGNCTEETEGKPLIAEAISLLLSFVPSNFSDNLFDGFVLEKLSAFSGVVSLPEFVLTYEPKGIRYSQMFAEQCESPFSNFG